MANTFFTKVVGVSKQNRDRRSRQKIIRDVCGSGRKLAFVREPANEYDPNAIAVWVEHGFFAPERSQIGYLGADLAAELAVFMDGGGRLVGSIKDITGGEEGKKTLGVNIEITKIDGVLAEAGAAADASSTPAAPAQPVGGAPAPIPISDLVAAAAAIFVVFCIVAVGLVIAKATGLIS